MWQGYFSGVDGFFICAKTLDTTIMVSLLRHAHLVHLMIVHTLHTWFVSCGLWHYSFRPLES
jgi:hypothetical protein